MDRLQIVPGIARPNALDSGVNVITAEFDTQAVRCSLSPDPDRHTLMHADRVFPVAMRLVPPSACMLYESVILTAKLIVDRFAL